MIEIKEIRDLDTEETEKVVTYNGISYIHQFGIYWMDLDKARPAAVISNNWFNTVHKKVLIAPMTSKDKYNHVPNEFRDMYIEVISFDGYLSYINIAEIQMVEKSAIVQRGKNSYAGQITDIDCITNILNAVSNLFNPSYNEIRISSSFQFSKAGGREMVTRQLVEPSPEEVPVINEPQELPINIKEEVSNINKETTIEPETELVYEDKETIVEPEFDESIFLVFPYSKHTFKEMYERKVMGYDNNAYVIDCIKEIMGQYFNVRMPPENNLKILSIIAIMLFKGKDLNKYCFDGNDSKRKRFEAILFDYIKQFEIVTPDLYNILDTYRSSNRKKSFYEVIKNM